MKKLSKSYVKARVSNTIMFNKAFTLGILLYSFSCYAAYGNYESPEYIEPSCEIRGKAAKKLSKKYGMYSIGFGGKLMDCVNLLSLSFEIERPLTKEEARELLIRCTQEFAEEVNNYEKIRPFLKNYPFTEKNIEVTIYSSDKNGNPNHYPFIAVAYQDEGKLIFRTKEKGQKFGYKTTEEERYQEALKIVRESESK